MADFSCTKKNTMIFASCEQFIYNHAYWVYKQFNSIR